MSSVTIDPHPLSPKRECPPPAPKAEGTHSPGGEGGGGSIFRKTPDIGWAFYSIIPLRIKYKRIKFSPLILQIHTSDVLTMYRFNKVYSEFWRKVSIQPFFTVSE